MNLFAIGDLHLPGGQDKPMEVFGPQWDRHFSRISENWREQVRPEDLVLIPGDISWAMTMADAMPDLEAIGALPGRKVMIRGNHDYWWSGIGKVRAALPADMFALQQDAMEWEDFVVCGTRGWMIPTEEAPLDPREEKIYRRELVRLDLALDAAKRLAKGRPIVVMLHYPPLYLGQRSSGFTERMERAGVRICVYGHLHGGGIAAGFNGEQGGIRYWLTSCDSQDFKLRKINFL
ncbi:MAG: metallophosphoesterase [Clostridia bacterium]|nr:metallophosphoesterase [Clostridia bacterium]